MASQAERIPGPVGPLAAPRTSDRPVIQNDFLRGAVVEPRRNLLTATREELPEHPTAPAHTRAGQTLSRRVVHRVLDLELAVTLVLLLAPLLLVAALLVKASGPGPVIFRHTRIGRQGKPFTCLKFRTMEHNAEELLADLIDTCGSMRAEWTLDQKIRRDPRVTPIGRFLRRFSIDELPQLWNVVRGEMSIVGPRPIVEAEAQRYRDHFEAYCSVKPGITGLWQVSGRNALSYNQRVELDCAYVSTKSIRGDCSIILRTLPVVLRGTGC